MENFERQLRKYRHRVRGIPNRPQPQPELTPVKPRGLLVRTVPWAVTGKNKGDEK